MFSFVKFAYNRIIYLTIDFSPFKIIFEFNLISSMNLIHLPLGEKISLDGEKKKKNGDKSL